MERQINNWYSPSLRKEMPIAKYGYGGFVLLMIPTAAADYLEYERFSLIDYLLPYLDAGKLQIFSIDSVNKESWMNYEMLPEHRAIRHNQFNHYVFDEVVPYVRNNTGPDNYIFTCGASFGAFHSMNLFLKRPDIINGAIGMSGVYDLTEYTRGFWDDQVYFNSPMHYIPNLTDPWYLDKIKASQHIHIYSGSGAHEDPDANRRFSDVLVSKGINNDLGIWGTDINHDWPTWRAMLPHIIASRF